MKATLQRLRLLPRGHRISVWQMRWLPHNRDELSDYLFACRLLARVLGVVVADWPNERTEP